MKFTHELSWNGREWWVTTYRTAWHRGTEPISGMPLTMFLNMAGDSGYETREQEGDR